MVLSRIRSILQKGVLEIIPRVYQLTDRGANIILITEEELTLIDTGLPGSLTRILDFIHSLGRSAEEIGLIIITHNHFDHAGGLAELRRLRSLDLGGIMSCRPFYFPGHRAGTS